MNIEFPPYWVSAEQFENLLVGWDPHGSKQASQEIRIPASCKLPIQTALKLVSLINQLISCGVRIILNFESTQGTYGYLSRMAFFECLAETVSVFPRRPTVSGAKIYGGGNPEIVEMHEVPLTYSKQANRLPELLSLSLRQVLDGRRDAETIEVHICTVLTEVLGNIYQHSGTPLAGLVALQPYKNASKVVLAVSDSGRGIPSTLRESASGKLGAMTESEIILKVFRDGLSRFGPQTGRGSGLLRCAQIALQYGAELNVRIPTSVVKLVPANGTYRENRAVCRDGAPLIWGTHLYFEFDLTRS
jgi:hypothetical protein